MISAATRAVIAASMATAAAAKVKAADEARSIALQTHAATVTAGLAGPKTSKPSTPRGAAGAAAPSSQSRNSAAKQPEVAPFYDAEALLAIGQRNADRETQFADMGADYAAQAAEATRGTQEAELQRIAGGEKTKNSAAARGLEHSSIRDAALDAVDTEAARKVSGLQSGLAITALQNDETRKRRSSSDADFMSAMAARAAENAAGVVRDPRGAPVPQAGRGPAKAGSSGHMQSPARRAQQALAQKRARNVVGSATLRRP